MTNRLNIIVAGLIGQYPIGGVSWDYVQYLLGLRDLGHNIVYLEDSEQWPYNPPAHGSSGGNADYNASYLAQVMMRFGLSDRWAYRFPGGTLPDGVRVPERWYGLSDAQRRRALARADLLINVSSGIGNPVRYRNVPRLAYVDTDPVFTQIRAVHDAGYRAHLDGHDVHFTYGECLSDKVPFTGHVWLPIRKPIALGEWHPSSPHREAFTTVMNWTSYADVSWDGRTYGQKDKEFLRFVDLPRFVPGTVLELAVGSGITRRVPRELLLNKGWHLVDPMECCGDTDSYRDYIQRSKAEWTPAKNAYVAGRSGWFSGRTACYLAAGRPVVVQDTGFAPVLPVGEGIVTFTNLEEASEGIRDVEGDWNRHARAARAIAGEYFDARKTVDRLIAHASRGALRSPTAGETAELG